MAKFVLFTRIFGASLTLAGFGTLIPAIHPVIWPASFWYDFGCGGVGCSGLAILVLVMPPKLGRKRRVERDYSNWENLMEWLCEDPSLQAASRIASSLHHQHVAARDTSGIVVVINGWRLHICESCGNDFRTRKYRKVAS